MWDLANWALDTARARGASFADARAMDIRQRDLSTKNGEVGTLAENESIGIGIRVIASGAWGFASTDRLTREGVQACAAQAVAIAKASALAKRHNVVMAPEQAHVDTWQSPFIKDPFQIPLERQLDLLLAADQEMRRVAGVTLAETSMQFRRIEYWFASSIGSRIHQVKMQSGGGITATSFQGDEIQKRSYPNSFGGQHTLQGYELIESLDFLRHAPRVAEEAVALHQAAQCPEGTGTILLESAQLGLQIHESVGHPIELDRVLGQEANFAGMSFLTLEKLNTLKYGSEIVNVVADARLEHGPSTRCDTARKSSMWLPTRVSSTARAWARLATTMKASPRSVLTSSRMASSRGTSRIARPLPPLAFLVPQARCAPRVGTACRLFA